MNRTAILFVEDDRHIHGHLLLKEEGYTVYTCENYKSALSVITTSPSTWRFWTYPAGRKRVRFV